MDKLTCVFRCFCLAFIIFNAQGANTPLEVKFLDVPDSIRVKKGEQVELNCHVNSGLSIILAYKIMIVHRSFLDLTKEDVLTEQQTLLPTAHPDLYDINFSYNNTDTEAILTIKKVVDEMDGQYICRAKAIAASSGASPLDAIVNVTVLSDVQAVELTVGETTVKQASAAVPIDLEQGSYDVACAASGFNDDASITVKLDGQVLATTPAKPVFDRAAATAAKARRYSMVTTKEKLLLRPSSKKIECTATAKFPDAVPQTASAPLSIFFEEPRVECAQNVSAMPGDMYVVLSCDVFTKNVKVDKYSWVLGDTGTEISQDLDDPTVYDEISVEPNGDVTKVILNLYKVGEEHFQTEYYLNVHIPEREGGPVRQAVKLIRLSPVSSGSAILFCATLLLITTAFTLLFTA